MNHITVLIIHDLRLQKKGCPYDRLSALETLRDYTLANVQDIEHVVKSGRRLNACPYFAARKGLGAAEVRKLHFVFSSLR
jgi:hypothetical protein